MYSQEVASGYYRVVTYFLAKLVCDLIPMRVIPTCVFVMIAYPLMGFQRSFDRFLTFFITIFLSSVFGSALCFLIAACIPVFGMRSSKNCLFLSNFCFSGGTDSINTGFFHNDGCQWFSRGLGKQMLCFTVGQMVQWHLIFVIFVKDQ